MKERNMQLQLDHTVINATLEYLATRPYREVMQLIPALQAAQPVPEPDATKPEEVTEHAADHEHNEA
jgi:hypothetical protein